MADDLKVIVKAKELVVHTLRITSNANRLCKDVNKGKLSRKKFNEEYTAWKNHASHGNCIKLCHNMDLMIDELLEN